MKHNFLKQENWYLLNQRRVGKEAHENMLHTTVIRQIWVETTMRHHYPSTRIIFKKLKIQRQYQMLGKMDFKWVIK